MSGNPEAPRSLAEAAGGAHFGAEIIPGGVRFRLWAPAARSVDLILDRGRVEIPLSADPAGFWETVSSGAGAGTRYRYRIDGRLLVPDPASRFQPDDVFGESEVIDPSAYAWSDAAWRGRPWTEAVLYELHVGCFTPQGTFDAARERLDDLAATGITAVSLMPLADFPGTRSWGYDGVLPYAPDASYGRPEDLKRFIDEAHAHGIMVLLDVVYNHFGPEGNWLGQYAPAFFTNRHETPWGDAIDFTQPVVREFFIRNALYWLDEFHLDGLRLDAVHAIFDDSPTHVIAELARCVRREPGARREVHLVLENGRNEAWPLGDDEGGRLYDAQWNDDFHHAVHVLLTGESGGYYRAFADEPARHLARSLAEGFAFQGEPSRSGGTRPRGEPSAHLPPSAFVSFLQNHDQIGNRAFGERLTRLADPRALRAATVLLLLSPSPPMLFMGQEWGTRKPFLYFCEFHPELGALVAKGRCEEFAHFPEFADPGRREMIPDPNACATRNASVLDWGEPELSEHRGWLDHTRRLLETRRQSITPRLAGMMGHAGTSRVLGEKAVEARWKLGDGSTLVIASNLGGERVEAPGLPESPPLHLTPGAGEALADGWLDAFATAAWLVERR